MFQSIVDYIGIGLREGVIFENDDNYHQSYIL